MDQLSDPQRRTLDGLASAIAAAPLNLVARRERPTLAAVHIPECVTIARALAPAAGSRWMDLGTGGGLPGLVCAVVRPDVRWVLVDATAKKAAAVRGFADSLGIDVEVRCGRAEELGHAADLRGAFDGVVARAVAPLPTLLELSVGFVRMSGTIAAIKGPRWEDEVHRARRAAVILGLTYVGAEELATDRPSWLVRYAADGPPPGRFPRRDGVPKAEPLH